MRRLINLAAFRADITDYQAVISGTDRRGARYLATGAQPTGDFRLGVALRDRSGAFNVYANLLYRAEICVFQRRRRFKTFRAVRMNGGCVSGPATGEV
jgi:hypothetical protein